MAGAARIGGARREPGCIPRGTMAMLFAGAGVAFSPQRLRFFPSPPASSAFSPQRLFLFVSPPAAGGAAAGGAPSAGAGGGGGGASEESAITQCPCEARYIISKIGHQTVLISVQVRSAQTKYYAFEVCHARWRVDAEHDGKLPKLTDEPVAE
jgi:hypothetical protein